jgi:hypothetical protein
LTYSIRPQVPAFEISRSVAGNQGVTEMFPAIAPIEGTDRDFAAITSKIVFGSSTSTGSHSF